MLGFSRASDVGATQFTVIPGMAYFHIRAINARSSFGMITMGHRTFPCLLGKRGRTPLKREGDGKSPVGHYRLLKAYYRPDKLIRPRTLLLLSPLAKNLGWCDDKNDGHYNRLITLPLAATHENLWRNDSAYDVVITTSHNQCPRIKNHGSAIFFHQIRPGATATEGCIAVSPAHMQLILQACARHTHIVI